MWRITLRVHTTHTPIAPHRRAMSDHPRPIDRPMTSDTAQAITTVQSESKSDPPPATATVYHAAWWDTYNCPIPKTTGPHEPDTCAYSEFHSRSMYGVCRAFRNATDRSVSITIYLNRTRYKIDLTIEKSTRPTQVNAAMWMLLSTQAVIGPHSFTVSSCTAKRAQVLIDEVNPSRNLSVATQLAVHSLPSLVNSMKADGPTIDMVELAQDYTVKLNQAIIDLSTAITRETVAANIQRLAPTVYSSTSDNVIRRLLLCYNLDITTDDALVPTVLAFSGFPLLRPSDRISIVIRTGNALHVLRPWKDFASATDCMLGTLSTMYELARTCDAHEFNEIKDGYETPPDVVVFDARDRFGPTGPEWNSDCTDGRRIKSQPCMSWSDLWKKYNVMTARTLFVAVGSGRSVDGPVDMCTGYDVDFSRISNDQELVDIVAGCLKYEVPDNNPYPLTGREISSSMTPSVDTRHNGIRLPVAIAIVQKAWRKKQPSEPQYLTAADYNEHWGFRPGIHKLSTAAREHTTP